MVNVPTRMRKLNKLLSIRLGPGAAILPKNVTRLHMEMATKVEGGFRGGRKFWRYMLPRLAYHNPSIPMTVHRTKDQEGPCVLSIHLASPASSPSDATPAASETETSSTTPNVLTIDMKMKQESEILVQLIEATGAKQVEPTQEEVELMRDLEEHSIKSENDSERSKAWRAQWKKEQNMLKAAREGTL